MPVGKRNPDSVTVGGGTLRRRLPDLKLQLFPAIEQMSEIRTFVPFEMEMRFRDMMRELGLDESRQTELLRTMSKILRRRKARPSR